jgi:DNA (cytosine-5)-methyltransferase 1
LSAYYNEFDSKAAATLRELITEGLIAPGDVDERSIDDVRPADLRGYTQVHLFAGFGIWSLAFRLAGWPDSRPVWSASCPCQPFSAAGKGAGFADERHLWPSAFWLLQHGKPAGVPVYGEQVASPDGMRWLDLVRADLETIGHACWSTVLASAGFGAPIIRQRSYWMGVERVACSDGGVAGNGRIQRGGEHGFVADDGGFVRVAGSGDGFVSQSFGEAEARDGAGSAGAVDGAASGPGATNGFWRDADWLLCRDDKWRPVEPGTFPLAHGYPERMGILRGAGNAISPQVAAAFIAAVG